MNTLPFLTTNLTAREILLLSLTLWSGWPVATLAATNEISAMSPAAAMAASYGSEHGHPVAVYAVTRVAFRIGDSTVHARTCLKQHAQPVMVNVHDDENTSIQAAKALIDKTGGHLIELSHTGKRNITFELKGREYAFDPNRIFTDAGIERILRGQGHFPREAEEEVKRFARQFIEFFVLDHQPAIIALHNNSEGSLSVKTYAAGGRLESDAIETFANPKMDPDDFFFVTDRRFFNHLKAKKLNVVLQDNARVSDDGSLSVYFARQGIPYVNVEAQNGHRRRQLKMLRAVRDMLKEVSMERSLPAPTKRD